MNQKPPKSKITTIQSGDSQTWDLPAKKGIDFLMIFGCFFGGIPLLIISVITYLSLFGKGESTIHSVWGIIGAFAFLALFIAAGAFIFYLGLKLRYTSFYITTRGGAVEIRRKFLNKETTNKIHQGDVFGVGLYSHSRTNNRPNYGLLVKARKKQDIKIASAHKEAELRWLASNMITSLEQQGGLPTSEDLEAQYFSAEATQDGEETHYAKHGVTISRLDESHQFTIEKKHSFTAKSLIFGGIFGVIFSSIFIWIGFGSAGGELIFGIVGSVITLASTFSIILGLTKLKTTEKFTFSADTIIREKLRGGINKSKTTFKKSSYNQLKIASSGSSNDAVRNSIQLIGKAGISPLKIFRWVDEDISEVVKHQVNAWLKPPTTPSAETESAPSYNNGYGSAMATEASQKPLKQSYSPQARTAPDQVPIYSSNLEFKDIKGGIWYLRAGLGLFLSIALGLLIFGLISFKTAKDSENWPSQSGTILTSNISINHGDDSTTYGAEVSYEFVVVGKTYQGDKVTISEISTSNRNRAKKIVQRYPIGKTANVYYDPTDPSNNVLEPGISGGNYLLPGIGLVFFIVALAILITTEKARKKNAQSKKQ